ncbi:MAG: methionyl-tRNA formyltransferase [Cellvibrionaceae bacterium]
MSKPLRIVFAGTPDFAAAHLQALLENSSEQYELVAVYSQPDRPAGRGKKLTPSPVKQLALDHELPVYQPLNFKAEEDRQALADLNPDLMIVVAYGLLLPQSVLDIPTLGCINVHGSLLPRWRGAAPIQRAIEEGDTETGITIMQMEAGLDTGPMILKAACPIEANETGGELHDKLIPLGQQALLETVSLLADGKANPDVQDDALSTYASKFSKEEMQVDWSKPAQAVFNKIRAFIPFPVAFSLSNGEKVRLWAAELVGSEWVSENINESATPGTILKADNTGLLIACGNGAILLTQIQIPGKKAMAVSEVLKARAERFAPGTVLG